MLINIIGYGFVGKSVGYLCKRNRIEFSIYDPITIDEDEATLIHTGLDSLVESSETRDYTNIYFICVPTPSDSEIGKCDTSIVEHVLDQLNQYCKKNTLVIIKSTVQPGTCKRLALKCSNNIELVFCPEFLREKTFEEDAYNADFALIGSSCKRSMLAEYVL